VRACMRACMRACVHDLQWTHIALLPHPLLAHVLQHLRSSSRIFSLFCLWRRSVFCAWSLSVFVRRGPDRSPPSPHSQCIFQDIMKNRLFISRKKEAVGDLRTHSHTEVSHERAACSFSRMSARSAWHSLTCPRQSIRV
jgi:hypothetical protein